MARMISSQVHQEPEESKGHTQWYMMERPLPMMVKESNMLTPIMKTKRTLDLLPPSRDPRLGKTSFRHDPFISHAYVVELSQ